MKETGRSGTLDEIAIECGTDKSSQLHDYTRHYEDYFRELKLDPIRLVEIGVAGGASIEMWHRYFCNGQILGIDHNPDVPRFEGNPAVRIEILDVAENWDRLVEVISQFKPNIVIDDGGHFAHAQRTAFGAIWPYVEPGGWYAIEDLCTAYRPQYGSIFPMLHRLIDDVNHHGAVEFAAKGPRPEVESIHFHPGLVLARKPLKC